MMHPFQFGGGIRHYDLDSSISIDLAAVFLPIAKRTS